MNPLHVLEASLASSFSRPLPNVNSWTEAEGMARVAAMVMLEHGGAGIHVNPASIFTAVRTYRKSGRIGKFRDLKYICLGISSVGEDGWCVLSDEHLRRQVFDNCEEQSEIRRRFRCFQALLSSYLTFGLNDQNTNAEAKEGWRELRKWLGVERDQLVAMAPVTPPWFPVLLRHQQLLTHQPCERFGADLLRGDASSLNDARQGLSIPDDSWVIEEAVFAQMKAASGLRDSFFKSTMPDLLPILLGQLNVRIGDVLKKRCVALLVSRYARCGDHPEHPGLRDCATSTIGNPWLRRADWDAWVRSDDRPDDEARNMVFGWLKGRLITDFFELLSADGANDSRRLVYWLRFAPFIEDMWFALGVSARTRSGSQFAEFRERAKGRLLNLEGTSADNNAFVMKVGAYLAVEFGASGNAFYLFRWTTLPESLRMTLNSGKNRASVHITALKNEVNELTMRHRDSPVALKSWEQKFDEQITRLIGRTPDARPVCVPELEALLNEHVKVEDRRGSGGALWIYETDRSSRLSRQLASMGLAYRASRGWSKE